MSLLQYTLLSDGSSDAMLMPIIDWLFNQHRPELGALGQLAAGMGSIGLALEKRLPEALRLYPCQILFVHRDAEREAIDVRVREIAGAGLPPTQSFVPVIPVRMTEAWLLSDESAIRTAANNRGGKARLGLPLKRNWETIPDPKKVLLDALEAASGKSGRALSRFKPQQHRHSVALHTDDFSALRGLASFDFFEAKLLEELRKI